MDTDKQRIIVVANKWWECDPMMNVLLHEQARPAQLGWPVSLNHPRQRPLKPSPETAPAPRAVFRMSSLDVEVWCISDLLEHLPDTADVQSSTEVKMRYLPRIFEDKRPALIIAFGTAGYPDNATQNGSVVIGSKVFMHDAHPKGENPNSKWESKLFDAVISSGITAEQFNALTVIETSPKVSVLSRLIIEPLNPAPQTLLLARHDYVAVGAVNVTDYSEYAATDAKALAAFAQNENISLARSLETTHGIIRCLSEAPFIFISGITDRVGHFAEEVAPRTYAQNFVAAHNAGIVLAWLLGRANDLHTKPSSASTSKDST